jgi:hypothetical protein
MPGRELSVKACLSCGKYETVRDLDTGEGM